MRNPFRAMAILACSMVVPACGGGGGGGAPVLTVMTTSLPAGTQGTAYSTNLAAVNGTTPYTWAISAGSLPQGLTLSAAGVISGTPTARSNLSFTVQVGDSAVPQNTAERLLSITINAPPLVIVDTSLPAGYATVPYSYQLRAIGGVQPYSWSSTALPAGLSRSTTGRITGTPTTIGTTSITFTLTDSVGMSTWKTLSITINPAPSVTISGKWTYDKVPISGSGLNLSGIFSRNVPYCFVGLENQAVPGAWYSTTYTDAAGNYSIPAPQNSTVKIYLYAFSANAAGSINVVDRASSGSPKRTWAVVTPNIAVSTVNISGSNWHISDATRVNGAINIVDIVIWIQSNVLGLNPSSNFGDATIEFSTNFYSGTSSFRGSTGFILGDRTTDSDEFDDPVIAHEYSHYLQSRFSRVDSTGGFHAADQIIDPRVAFGEGQATFMGQMFLGYPQYIDTKPSTASVTNIETVATSNKGYWNEHSVSKVLWDCFDTTNEAGDSLSLPFSLYWAVFTQDMMGHSLVYLIDFMDSLYLRSPGSGGPIAAILAMESITYTPGAVPSVPNPWPYFLPNGVPVNAFLDSSVDRQWNLMIATDVFYFTIPSSRSVTVTLTHTGEGPSPSAPDYVTVYIFNDRGHAYSPDGELFKIGSAPAGTGYTYSTTVSLPAAGVYSVVTTTCFPYPPGGGANPFIFSSANYRITANY